jgi:hypothetical protein
MQEEEKRLKNEGRETLEETVQKLISKAGSHMESTLIGNSILNEVFLAVPWICYIFVHIRIWIRGSLYLRILLFSSVAFKIPTKNIFIFQNFLAYFFVKVHLHHSLKIKSHKEVTNSTVLIKVFLTICAW